MTIHSFKVFHPRNAIDAPQKMRVIAHLIVFKSYMCTNGIDRIIKPNTQTYHKVPLERNYKEAVTVSEQSR